MLAFPPGSDNCAALRLIAIIRDVIANTAHPSHAIMAGTARERMG